MIAASAAFCVGYGPDAENCPWDIPGVSVSITQNCEQGDADRPPLAFLFAKVFGFDDVVFFGIALGLRGRWGRQVLDVRQKLKDALSP